MILPATATLLDPAALRCWAVTSEATLRSRRGDLDALNVFPVADADTGTNLYLTFAEAASSVDRAPADAGAHDLAGVFARGALVGARGNSGVIVGQYLGALVRALLGSGLVLTPAVLAGGLEAAARAAYQAVAQPVEGTVLTIGRAVSTHARAAVRDGVVGGASSSAVDVLDAAIVEGYRALQLTTSQLPALRAAGVLDAGAWGLLLVLDAFAHCLGSHVALERSAAGVRYPGGPTGPASTCVATGRDAGRGQHVGIDLPEAERLEAHAADGESGGGEFEVMYLVATPDPTHAGADLAAPLRSGLSAVGESAAVVGGEGLWQVHVHTDRPLDALDVAAGVGGAVSQVRVRHLATQSGVHGHHRPPLGLVAVTAAPGLVADLARAGAVVVLVPAGGTAGPELRRAVEDTGASRVLLLSAVPLATPPAGEGLEVLDGLTEPQVVCGAATSASLDPSEGPEARLADVMEAVRGVRSVVVPAPARDDVTGLGHGELVLQAVERLLVAGGSLVTVVTGSATGDDALAGLRARCARDAQGVELVVLTGGTPGRDVVLGVE